MNRRFWVVPVRVTDCNGELLDSGLIPLADCPSSLWGAFGVWCKIKQVVKARQVILSPSDMKYLRVLWAKEKT